MEPDAAPREPAIPPALTWGRETVTRGNRAALDLGLAQELGWEPACKPGSVMDGHSSGMHVAVHLKRPTRGPCGPHVATEAARPPIWSCSGWGLPCHCCYQQRGALLPHHFTLTNRPVGRWRYIFCGTFRRLAPPRRYLAPCPSEPGLSSTFCKAATIRPTPGEESSPITPPVQAQSRRPPLAI